MKDIHNTKINIDLLNKLSKKPEPFAKGEALFWNDAHISKGMLQAHLDPDWDAASRKHATIKESCDWITSGLRLPGDAEIIDLGCGPGLYCTLLSQKGFNVTGMDYSERSIEYARQTAKEKGLRIDYVFQDYLTMDYAEKFDLALLVYFDLGVFSDNDRDSLLKRVWHSLKSNGYFVFDLMTLMAPHEEKSSWSIFQQGGFWKPNAYIELFQSFYYEEYAALLRQHIIIEDNGKISVYRLWDRYYWVEEITRFLNQNGFDVVDIYSDLTGKAYQKTSQTLGVIARKK